MWPAVSGAGAGFFMAVLYALPPKTGGCGVARPNRWLWSDPSGCGVARLVVEWTNRGIGVRGFPGPFSRGCHTVGQFELQGFLKN